jgi:hypothetical protein
MNKVITVLSLFLLVLHVTSFCPSQSIHKVPSSGIQIPLSSPFTSNLSSTHLFDRKEPYEGGNSIDGMGRGIVLQVIVLIICAWLFTIPPEFRRTYFCPAENYCQEPGSCEKPCTTYKEWFRNVGDYYKNGGGIQWDFSIDPKTLEENAELLGVK